MPKTMCLQNVCICNEGTLKSVNQQCVSLLLSIEAEKLREDLRQITMHYESKCEDYKLLEDRLARTKQEYQTHINQLVKRYGSKYDMVDVNHIMSH